MKRIIVAPMPDRPGVYLLTVAGGRQIQAGFDSVPEPITREALPQALIRRGFDPLDANNAASEVDKRGLWIQDLPE